MLDLPTPFSAPMVLALLAGRKLETRRVLSERRIGREALEHGKDPVHVKGRQWRFSYGQPFMVPFAKGCRLYVREEIEARISGAQKSVRYSADQVDSTHDWPPEWHRDKARPMHMFKRFSRMTLPVIGVRIERLHDITDAGAIAEGIERVSYEQCIQEHGGSTFNPEYAGMYGWRNYDRADPTSLIPFHHDKPVLSYQSLWNSINGTNAWDANPWVTVTSWSHVIHQNVDRIQP